tara:strand:+ start:1014 stop:2048 length:1035 start_codon:yes stop_codon:yes gene_type:complete
MIKNTSEIFIEGKSVDFTQASFKDRGGSTAAELNFILPLGETNYRKYWNKEVTFYFQEGDGVPLFRGRILNSTISANTSVKLKAVDILGFLTGHQRARVVLDDDKNIDGLTGGASIVKLIRMANLNNIIGTDFLGDTSPIITNESPRGVVTILDEITTYLKKAVDLTNEDLPRQNVIVVKDDGSKGQLRIETMADIETATPIKFYSYDRNIVSFLAVDRHIPTTVIVKGDGVSASFTHTSAAAAHGDYFFELTNKKLKSKAECMDFAQKIFRANVKAKYEYTLNTFEGAYLEENDVIYITDDETGIDGNFRVIGKTIVFSPNSFKLRLFINKRPPILGEYLQTK